ncbi:hypothetical protein ACO0R3_001299 [Hanseniaspora guilliermondii]
MSTIQEQEQFHHSREATDTSKIGPWKMAETIGFGSSGKVRLAIHERTGQQAAVKIVSKSLFMAHQNTTSTVAGGNEDKDFLPYGIEREIIIMKLLNHPNVLRLYDVWETETDLFMVLEYVEKGELFKLLVERGPLTEREAVRFFRQIIIGISYCHALGIAHRDLKPENLLLDHKSNIKIADFGMAALETKDKLLETSCGSPHYASPEIVSGLPYQGFESDVWSCGVILYALLTGVLPFDEENGDIRQILLKVQAGRFYMPENISKEAQDLLSRILTVDPKQRIGTRDILKHPLLKKYPSIKDSMSIRNLPREDTYLNPLADGADIDPSILNNLVVLWNGKDRQEIIKSLKEPKANLEKTFYGLLYNFKVGIQQQHKMLMADDETVMNKRSKKRTSPQKQKRYSSSTSSFSGLPKSQSKRLSQISTSSVGRKSSVSRPTSQYLTNQKHLHTPSSASSSNSNDVTSGSLGSTPLKRNGTLTYVVDDGLSPSRDPPPPPMETPKDLQPEQIEEAVANKRISKSISKRLSRNISRNSLISLNQETMFNNSPEKNNIEYSTLGQTSRQGKRSSLTTKLISTYAKLTTLQESDWGYIETETRRTSQSFAHLIDEVFEYEMLEKERKKMMKEKMMKERELKKREEELRKEIEEKERVLREEQHKRELAEKREREKLESENLKREKCLKVMVYERKLEGRLAKTRERLEYLKGLLNEESLDMLKEINLDEYMNDEASISDFDEEIEELVDDNGSSFTIDDYEKDEPSHDEDIPKEKEEDDSEKTIENNDEVNKRSVSEPTKHSLPEDVANLQKRAFSLSTRPVSRLDPGIYGYESSTNNSKTMLPEESEEESEFESDEEETTVYDEAEVERRMMESLRRSKFLGSQFDLAMKLASTGLSSTSTKAAKRRSLLAIQSQYGGNVMKKKRHSMKRKSARKSLTKKKDLLISDDGDTPLDESKAVSNGTEDDNTVLVHELENKGDEKNKLSDVVIPKVLKNAENEKRMSLLSTFSSTNLSKHLDAGDKDEEKFLFEDKNYEEDGEVEIVEKMDGEIVKSRSSQMRLNFADRFTGSDEEEVEEIKLPELPPVDQTKTVRNSLMLEEKLKENERRLNETQERKEEKKIVLPKKNDVVKQTVQRKKSGIFRIFTPSGEVDEEEKKIKYGDEYDKDLLRKIYYQFKEWEKSKFGLKHIETDGKTFIKGGISNENVLSLRSTAFELTIKDNHIRLKKLSGSKKSFNRFSKELEKMVKIKKFVPTNIYME